MIKLLQEGDAVQKKNVGDFQAGVSLKFGASTNKMVNFSKRSIPKKMKTEDKQQEK